MTKPQKLYDWQVQGGPLNKIVRASTGESACRLFIVRYKPKWLGSLIRFTKGNEPWRYIDPRVCIPRNRLLP